MAARQSLYVTAMYGSIVLAVVVATVILGVQGTLDSSSVLGILGAAIGFAGGSAASNGAVGAAVNGKATIPTAELANREQTLRTAIVASAAAPSHVIESEPTIVPEPEA